MPRSRYKCRFSGTHVAISNTQVAAASGSTSRLVWEWTPWDEVKEHMVGHVLWHGTQVEALDLLQSLNRNCSCVFTADGTRLSTCAPHQMLATDQRAIDGLLFARRIADRLRIEEYSPGSALSALS